MKLRNQLIPFIKIFFIFSGLTLIPGIQKACAQCAGLETYTSNPLPTNNTYPSSTTVTFCYTLDGFFQNGSNWVDGFIITLGSGWDASTLTPTLTPNSCDGGGFWGFYQSVTSQGNGGTYGPGFFYDRYDLSGNFDSLPGNDYGDFTLTGTCEWNLCFSVTSNPTCANPDLSVSVTAAGDGAVGSWSSNNCPGIPFFLSTASCNANCTGFSAAVTGVNPGCIGNNGSASSIVVGGISPYSYQWSNANTNSSISGLSIGTYVLTVTDLNGCPYQDSVTLVLPPAISLTSSVVNATCLSYCNGAISVAPFGGQLPYSYSWSNGLPPIANPNSLCAGVYYVTVSDPNFCVAIDTLTVTEPTGMALNISSTPTTCNGGCDGALSAVVSSGTSPYNLVWFNGSTDSNITNICSGNYALTATDANGCTLLGNGIVIEPSAIVVTTHSHNVTCSGLSDGWISFTEQYASLPYNVIWNPGGIMTDTIKNLFAGTYDVMLTDNNGCTGYSNANVIEPDSLTLNFISTLTSCLISSDGIVSVIASGGTPLYAYNWINPSGNSSAMISNLPVGYYEVIVTDINGCSTSIGDSIKAGNLFGVFAYGDTTIVNENSTTIGLILSQSGSFSYSWSPVESVSNPNSAATIVSPAVTITYTVNVIENSTGCTNSDSVVVIVLPTTYLFVPNAFTPNDDGFNDLFQLIKGEYVIINEVQIFNRWGQLVYRQPELNWDGKNRDEKICSVGTYAYYIVYSIQGDPSTYRKVGNVTLIR